MTQTNLTRKSSPPGFLTGAAQVFSAIKFVANNPGTWPWALIPAVLFLVLFGAGTILGWKWLTPWVMSFFAAPEVWWSTLLQWLARVALYVTSLLVGAWTALLLTPPLSGPALEQLVAAQESELQVAERTPPGFWVELIYGIKAQLLAVAFAAPIVLGLWVLELIVPPLAIIITPLKALITALALAWNLFDYPLTLRGVTASDRLGFVVNHWPALLGFGLVFAALFWVPCFGILMLPVGVVGATRLLYALLEADPNDLPGLPRPARGLPPSAPVESISDPAAEPFGH